MRKRILIYANALALLVLLAAVAWRIERLRTHGRPVVVHLTRGDLTVLEFPPLRGPLRATMLFASGDGGWGPLEEAIAHGLQKRGCKVIGIDSTAYAKTDYDMATLQADYGKMARSAEAGFGSHPLPLIVGGYSMGAAQAIAVCGGPNPPPGLAGLLLMDPLSRGRYGLRTEDKMNILPTGPGTFAAADFSRSMAVPVLQWHAQNDTIDSDAWLASLAVPSDRRIFPGTGHGYRHDRDHFVRDLVNSLDWLLQPGETTVRMATP